jgi:hypothetical protein
LLLGLQILRAFFLPYLRFVLGLLFPLLHLHLRPVSVLGAVDRPRSLSWSRRRHGRAARSHVPLKVLLRYRFTWLVVIALGLNRVLLFHSARIAATGVLTLIAW